MAGRKGRGGTTSHPKFTTGVTKPSTPQSQKPSRPKGK